jgi:IS30 family transposase
MRGYQQLTQKERYPILAFMNAGHSQTEIAALLGQCKFTLSRELRGNRGLHGNQPQLAASAGAPAPPDQGWSKYPQCDLTLGRLAAA